MGIHRPAPTMVQPTMQAAYKLLERIPPHQPIRRASWNVKITDQLDLSTPYSADYNDNLARLAPTLTPSNTGNQIFIRTERQTFTRLPRSGAILFGIHTYQNTLDNEALGLDRAQRMLDYKAIAPFEDALINFWKIQ